MGKIACSGAQLFANPGLAPDSCPTCTICLLLDLILFTAITLIFSDCKELSTMTECLVKYGFVLHWTRIGLLLEIPFRKRKMPPRRP